MNLEQELYSDLLELHQSFQKTNPKIFKPLTEQFESEPERKSLRVDFNRALNCNRFPSPNEKSKTTIYLVRNTRTKEVKIGITSHLEKRVRKMFNAAGIEMEIIAYADNLHIDALALEKFIHAFYSDHRRNGEWFCLRQKHIDRITELYNHIQGKTRGSLFYVPEKKNRR